MGYVAVLTSTIHRTVEARACQGGDACLAYGDIGVVDETEEVVTGGITINDLTAAAAEHGAVRNLILERVTGLSGGEHTEGATINIHVGTSAGVNQSLFSLGGFGVAALDTDVVALTHGGEVAATEHAAHHIASININIGVAIHLTCGEAVGAVVFALALASTIHGVADEAVGKGDFGVFLHMAILTTAIHRAGDAIASTHFAVGCVPFLP